MLIVLALGFALGGMVTSADALLGGKMRFRADLSSPWAAAWSFVLSAIGGPVIVAASGWKAWRRRKLPAAALGVILVLACLWSLCAGTVALRALQLV